MTQNPKPVRRRKRKVILLVIELAMIAVICVGIYAGRVLNSFDNQELNSANIQTNKLDPETEKLLSGYTTIACFGLDNRKQGTYTNGNTDVIMLISINNDTKDIKVVSVYRDTLLDVGSTEVMYRKANSAYSRGGAEQAESLLNKNLDISVDNYVSFDFSAVAKAIDILGGVDIDIDSEEELGYINKYIKHTNGILGTDAETIDSTGTQTLNGVQAVAYSRIRYTAGGDFKRAKRQRIVLGQMMNKAKSAKISQLNQVIKEVFPMISTDLQQDQMISLMSAVVKYGMDDMRGFPFARTTATLSGRGSCVIPCDLSTNVVELHKYLYGDEDYQVSHTVDAYNTDIINITGYTKDSAMQDEFNNADNDQAPGDDDEEDLNAEP